MTYETARQLLSKTSEVGFGIIEDAIRQMPLDEFMMIPVIDDYTKVTAIKYGYCFTVYKTPGHYNRYYEMFLIGSVIFREKNETQLNKQQ